MNPKFEATPKASVTIIKSQTPPPASRYASCTLEEAGEEKKKKKQFTVKVLKQ